MKPFSRSILIGSGLALMLLLMIALPALAQIKPATSVQAVSAQAAPAQAAPAPDVNAPSACTVLGKPSEVPQAALINFDDLTANTVIADRYLATFGVRFEDSRVTQAIIYANEPAKAASAPNVASNNATTGNTSANVPLLIQFTSAKSHVGFYIGNSNDTAIIAVLTAYDGNDKAICTARYPTVPEAATLFVGFYDPNGAIMKITLDYGNSFLSEVIDDLYFAPRQELPAARKPLPSWTPLPTAVPTAGSTPTAVPLIPLAAYHVVQKLVYVPNLITPDLSIHGIEITQGIQCYDTSKGLAGCADNSLPLVNKKDTTARIYLKVTGPFTSFANVPVRLFLKANNVDYQVDAVGKAISTLDRGRDDNANVYFVVNFNSTVAVDFYAIVDPNGVINETNETNNRFPAAGTIHLNFQSRTALKVVGRRVDYHPSGYAGTRYAGGWAVNGGAADWWEQLLPIRNNGIDYSVAGGYLNWTSWLTPCNTTGDAQHAMIQTLNMQWLMENMFGFLFSGAFTGADHVYGWVPNAGYPCGHADMPVYPHAGGLGVVGIGGDAPGASTDNPASGALIFGHELTHDYDLKHTNTADACGSNDSTSTFPYATSSIQEFGFNPTTGKIYDPATTHDLMSYCPSGGSKQGWISPYTWQQMFNNLSSPTVSLVQPEGPAPLGILSPSGAADSLVVKLTVFNPLTMPGSGGQLGYLYKANAGLQIPLAKGPYAVELLNVDNTTIISQTFLVNFSSEYDGHNGPEGLNTAPPFSPGDNNMQNVSFIMPWVAGTTSVRLTYQGQTLDQKNVSANPPQVLFTSPTTAETWQAGSTHLLTWQALDIDGDTLEYSLFYSKDGGALWNLLAADLTDPSYSLQTDTMPGGSDIRFRLVASDGVLVGIAETDQSVTIPNHAPVPLILNPIANSIHDPGTLVVLQGIATDLEDGTLPDEALKWSSNIQGSLGIGPSLGLNNLIKGTHIIRLTATDQFGVQSFTTVKVVIANSVFLPALRR